MENVAKTMLDHSVDQSDSSSAEDHNVNQILVAMADEHDITCILEMNDNVLEVHAVVVLI